MMPLPAQSPFADWENFYVIVGSSAAALTGLQFVVIALIADAGAKTGGREIAAFGTPTVVHFCAALLASAIVSAPWRSLVSPAFAIAALGVAGVVYAIIVTQRARVQTGYQPVFEDWLWHSILPFGAYGAMVAASFMLRQDPEGALFLVGGGSLLLLFVGIHNAWDTVTFITLKYRTATDESNASGGSA
ncbi:MAG TPA: hypothetical protein VJO52_02580 [Gemmatimonadaceae bacterium]|nr:hypothetical protein [Gemmatimonadaceae bacterium]